MYFDPDSLEPGPFVQFGGEPGKNLPDPESFRAAKHARAAAQGVKAERPNHHIVNKGQFARIEAIDDLWHQLFGKA